MDFNRIPPIAQPNILPDIHMPLTSLTLITSPYHVGLRASPHHRTRVSEGPDYLLGKPAPAGDDNNLVALLHRHAIPFTSVEIPPVSDDPAFDGDISRTFELLRRVSRAVSTARERGSFPVVLAGNCCVSVGVAAGLEASLESGSEAGELAGAGNHSGLGCVWFDAHDDYNVPDTVLSGYFDSQGVAMLAGECWKALLGTVPGFRPVDLRKVVHCGMRDVNELERGRVEGSEMGVVWGGEGRKQDFEAGLRRELQARFGGSREAPVLVHLDVDALDTSLGKANQFACEGGLLEEDLVGCMAAMSEQTLPVALTIASFDPLHDGDDSARRLTAVTLQGVDRLLKGMKGRGLIQPE